MSIKLKKAVKDVNGFSYTVWEFKGDGHLPDGFAYRTNGKWRVRVNDDRFTDLCHVNHMGDDKFYFSKKSDAINYIESYDKLASEHFKKIEMLNLERKLKVKADYEHCKMLTNNWLLPINNIKFDGKVGDVINVMMCSLSKPNSVGEALSYVNKGSNTISKARIAHVIKLSDAEYMSLVRDFYNTDVKFEGGGSVCENYEALFGKKEYMSLSNEEMEILRENSKLSVTVVYSDFGKPFVVDPSGHDYVRYCGFIVN